MKYKFEATQTIFKYIEVEAESNEEALEKADELLGEGEIHFDEEPFLKVECNIKPIDYGSLADAARLTTPTTSATHTRILRQQGGQC